MMVKFCVVNGRSHIKSLKYIKCRFFIIPKEDVMM